MSKVILGMSGGVDSSVTAHILKEQGYEVEGVSFLLWEARMRNDFSGCCSLESTQSASQTAEHLGIVHTSVDVRVEFIEKVIEPFADAYFRGLTPNPCILCNKHIKFPFLLKEAEKRGAEYISTGHYARTARDETGNGSVLLKKGVDSRKDQSYVLYVLRNEMVKRLLLPLGDYTKDKVREIARNLNLEAAERPESQEICFINDNDYGGFLEKLSPSLCRPGTLRDLKGQELGTHKGIYRYTIGQRKGLGISSLLPYYVTKIDVETNTVYVGPRENARCREVTVKELNWLVAPKSDSFRATVKVRSMMKDMPAAIEMHGEIVRVVFDEPQWAPAPGQSAAIYDGDIVMGGGIIQPQ